MKLLSYIGVLALTASWPADCPGASQSILAPGAKLQKLAGDFAFTEGPASDKKGNVYFTDQPNNRILKWSVEGQLSTWMQPAGRANGLCFDSAGHLWAAADEKNELWRIAPDGGVEVVAGSFESSRFNGPNDIWIHPRGKVYFTDPFYKRAYWDRGPKAMGEHVFAVDRANGSIVRVIEDLKQPNGIIGTADGKTLYVSDIRDKKTYRYRIQKDGTLTDRQLHCEMGSDGMTIDNRGNVYLTNKGVFVFDAAGHQVEHIEVPEPWTANVCFGGKNRRTLFITASKGLYSIEMAVKGVGSQ